METITAIQDDRINPKFMGLMFGVPGVITAVVGNIVMDLFREDYPEHWLIEDILNEPDWEDWRDFLSLNNGGVRTQ